MNIEIWVDTLISGHQPTQEQIIIPAGYWLSQIFQSETGRTQLIFTNEGKK